MYLKKSDKTFFQQKSIDYEYSNPDNKHDQIQKNVSLSLVYLSLDLDFIEF